MCQLDALLQSNRQ